MIALIDYGAGNLKSVANALNDFEADYFITDKTEEINSAEKIIFPGVGEAASAISKLNDKQIFDTIKDTKKPLLGICLGMQLLATFSEERNTKCLDVISTIVKQFDATEVKVPHMGWNSLRIVQLENPLLSNISNGEYVYFVHSYYGEPEEADVRRIEA